jgi:hypothetical protein
MAVNWAERTVAMRVVKMAVQRDGLMAVMRAANSDVQRAGLRVLSWVDQKAD